MPSKKSNPSRTRSKAPKAVCGFAERDLPKLASQLAHGLEPGDWVILEGPMGAGKSTLARALLRELGISQSPEGSPTFAIAHEYASPRGAVVHVDLYRLKSEAEIEAAGVPAYFWERDAIVLVEWASMWPEFEASLLAPSAAERDGARRRARIRVSLSFVEGDDSLRDARIERI